jgi:mono/diheme cytochrome c family protein
MKTECDTARGRGGDAATRLGAPSLFASWRLRVLAFMIFAFCFVSFALRPASAHEPITTKVRFNKEVVRVLQRSCLGCHRPGGIAMSLATYDEARPWAKAIKEELLEKRMPPWRAVKGYGEFRNAPSLTQRDVDLIVNWVEGGAPKGDEKDLPAGPLFSNDWQLGKPDLTLKPENESKIAGDAAEFRTFVLATKLKEDRWLTAIDLQPGNGTVVHCAKFYSLKSVADGPVAPMMQVKNEESASSVDLRSAPVLATWMPGQKPVALDAGVAQLLPAGSRIAVRIHYRGSGEAGNDVSTAGLYFAKTPLRKQLQEIAITNADAIIPVAAEPYPLKVSFTTQRDAEAIAIRPHVHPLVVSLQATAYRPDGSAEVLIWTRGYQFDWEPTYYFKQPVPLPKGTRVEVIAYFDNSDNNQNNPNNPPKSVRWSDLTPDPLCALLVVNNGAATAPPTAR